MSTIVMGHIQVILLTGSEQGDGDEQDQEAVTLQPGLEGLVNLSPFFLVASWTESVEAYEQVSPSPPSSKTESTVSGSRKRSKSRRSTKSRTRSLTVASGQVSVATVAVGVNSEAEEEAVRERYAVQDGEL